MSEIKNFVCTEKGGRQNREFPVKISFRGLKKNFVNVIMNITGLR